MNKKQKTAIYFAILLVASMAKSAFASDFLKCADKTLKNCEEITKGQAVREQALNPKTIIIKVDQVELSEKGTLKAKSN